MKTHDFRLLGSGCCAWACVAGLLAVGARWEHFLLAGGFFLTVSCAGLAGRGGRSLFVALGGALTAVLCLTTAAHEFTATRGPLASLAGETASVQARLVVTKEPVPLKNARPDAAGSVLIAGKMVEIRARGKIERIQAPVLVIGGKGWRDLRWRQTVDVRGRLAPAERGKQAKAVVIARGDPTRLNEAPGGLRWFESARATLRESFAGVPRDPRGLGPALVDGDVSQLPSDLKEVMDDVGLSHLNAVSGSNVTMVLVASIWVSGWFRLRRWGRLLTGMLTLGCFVALCHPDPSVIRAAMMGAVGVLGTSASRSRAACPALGAAIAVLLTWEPWLALSVGFALSSLATLGLVLFARPWTSWLAARLPPWCAKPSEMMIIPVAASSLCLPLLVALNGSISLVSIPANILAEPLVAPATLGGIVLLLIGPLPLALRTPVAMLVALPSWGIAAVARLTHAVPGGSLPWASGWVGALGMGAVLMVGLFAWRVIVHARWWGALSAIAVWLLVLAATSPVPGRQDVPPRWRYVACDVGQGDGGLVSTGRLGHAVAIDVGPEDTDGMLHCLSRHHVSALDAVFLSHFHADHVGALNKVFKAVEIGDVFVTPVREGSDERGHGERGAAPEVEKALWAAGRSARAIQPGQSVTMGDLRIDVLWPNRVIHEGSVQNNASLVLDVSAPDAHLLFLGDAEKEADLAVKTAVEHRAAARPYDVVKVGHHGSSNQDPELYRAARARFGAIGVGADNDYGHPSKKLLAMLAEAQTSACRTDELGEVTFSDTGQGLVPQSQRSTC